MEITFRQPRRRLMLVVTLVYLAAFLIVVTVFFDPLAEIVNDLATGGAKGTGMIAGAVVFLPLIAILVLAAQRVELRRDANTLTVRAGRRETFIPIRDVARLTVNAPQVGRIRLFSPRGDLMIELHPQPKDAASVLAFLTADGAFVESARRPILGGRAQSIDYERASPQNIPD